MADGNSLSPNTNPDEDAADRWSAWFLSCLGLGLILTGTGILVQERTFGLPAILWLYGAGALAAGIRWRWLKPQLSAGLSSSVGAVANDLRYWLVVVAALVLIAGAAPAFYSAPSATNSTSSRTSKAVSADRLVSRPV